MHKPAWDKRPRRLCLAVKSVRQPETDSVAYRQGKDDGLGLAVESSFFHDRFHNVVASLSRYDDQMDFLFAGDEKPKNFSV